MATDKREDAIGSDDAGAIVAVQAELKNPVDVTLPPLPPGEAPPTSVDLQVFKLVRQELGIELPPKEKRNGQTPGEYTVSELKRRGHDGVYVELPQLNEEWVMTWDTKGVKHVATLPGDEDED
jgi:hypothetical protein